MRRFSAFDTLPTLRAARALISDPRRWTQGQDQPLFKGARDAQGRDCWPCDPEAVSWCATGAIAKVEGRDIGRELPERALDAGLSYAFGAWPTTAYFNDRRSHEDVLAVPSWPSLLARPRASHGGGRSLMPASGKS
jgi:hypothetical protein